MSRKLMFVFAVLPASSAYAAPTWECYFDEGVTSNWNTGQLKIEEGKFSKDSPTLFTFEIVDESQNLAEFSANMGSSPVIFFRTSKGITFLEQIPTGNVTMTTVFTNLKAVHSRHGVAGLPVPSQFYGECTELE